MWFFRCMLSAVPVYGVCGRLWQVRSEQYVEPSDDRNTVCGIPGGDIVALVSMRRHCTEGAVGFVLVSSFPLPGQGQSAEFSVGR